MPTDNVIVILAHCNFIHNNIISLSGFNAINY